MEKYKRFFNEDITIPLKKGDTFLWGKWKNKKAVFDHIEQDDKGQDVIATDNGKKIPLLKIRLVKESKLEEDLHLKDFAKHSGASDFTKDWIEIRRKIVGAGNRSSKLHSIKVNRKKDYIIFIFKSKPTYDAVADSVDVNSFAKGKKVRKYTQRIMVLDFFKYLETKSNYEDANVTWKEIKECLDVCPIKVDCNCMAQTYQGLSYYLTQLDGAIVPNNIRPRVWNKYHDINGDVGFLCKHLSLTFSQISFWANPMTSMLNKYLKQKKN